jgi:trimethylamine--corrinoid protein Co-methyltransferase
MVFDNEMIAGMRRMWEGITLHDPTEEVELIKSLTPRGNFISTTHTRCNYQQHWYPEIISRDTYETWKNKGESIAQICQRKAQDILIEHKPVPLPAEVESEIERIIRRFLPNFRLD